MAEVICKGCGARLQSERPDEPGYLPASAQAKEEAVCRRCYRIRHYGEFSRVGVSSDVYAAQVSKVLQSPGLVLYVLDVFDLSGSVIEGLHRFIGDSEVVVVVNKVDLLPREVPVTALETWVRATVERTGVYPTRVQFVSAESQVGLDAVIDLVRATDADRVYVVGMANVGKSTLLNRVIARFIHTEPFTASRVPGTTLGLVGANVNIGPSKSIELIDTPGLIAHHRVTDKLCSDCLKKAVPQARLRPRIFQLNRGQSLWLGGFARMDFEEGPWQSVVCYVSNELVVHRTKIENAERIGELHADDILRTPCSSCRRELGDRLPYPVALGRFRDSHKDVPHILTGGKSGCDLVLAGLGWMSLTGADFYGTLWVPRGIEVDVRPRLIGTLTHQNSGRT